MRKPKRKNKPGAGRPVGTLSHWQPTDHERNQVKTLAGYGLPSEDVAAVLGVSRRTLAKYCAAELRSGPPLAIARAANFLFSIFSPPNNLPVQDLRLGMLSAMFFLKARGGWRDGDAITVVKHADAESLPVVTNGARSRLITELDQMAARIGQVESGEIGAGDDGGPVVAAEADPETLH